MNDAETIFERLEQHGKTWKIYVMEPMPLSFHGIIHYSAAEGPAGDALRAVRRVRERRGRRDPARLLAHRAEHASPGTATTTPRSAARSAPASTPRRWIPRPRCWAARRSWRGSSPPTAPAPSESGSNVWNTTLLIGWDEPGGTYDHVPPGPVPPPDPDAPAGELGFTFDRSGYRVPAILVSPWVAEGSVFNDEYRHTSLIATLREGLGSRRAVHPARRLRAHLRRPLHPRQPRDPETWATITAAPRPGVAPRRRGPQQGAQRPRQDHGTGLHRARAGAGTRASAGT